jgi:hypothetical protein
MECFFHIKNIMEHITIALSEENTQVALHPHFMEKPHVFP